MSWRTRQYLRALRGRLQCEWSSRRVESRQLERRPRPRRPRLPRLHGPPSGPTRAWRHRARPSVAPVVKACARACNNWPGFTHPRFVSQHGRRAVLHAGDSVVDGTGRCAHAGAARYARGMTNTKIRATLNTTRYRTEPVYVQEIVTVKEYQMIKKPLYTAYLCKNSPEKPRIAHNCPKSPKIAQNRPKSRRRRNSCKRVFSPKNP